MNVQFVRTTDIQRNFKAVLAKLHAANEPLVVMRDSVPEAVMLSYAEYRRISDIDKQLITARFEKMWKEIGKRNTNVSDAELDADIERAKQYARRRR